MASDAERAFAMRAITRAAEKAGRRFVWWSRVPRELELPPWWRWTITLTYALAARFVAIRCAELGGPLLDWPPRLP